MSIAGKPCARAENSGLFCLQSAPASALPVPTRTPHGRLTDRVENQAQRNRLYEATAVVCHELPPEWSALLAAHSASQAAAPESAARNGSTTAVPERLLQAVHELVFASAPTDRLQRAGEAGRDSTTGSRGQSAPRQAPVESPGRSAAYAGRTNVPSEQFEGRALPEGEVRLGVERIFGPQGLRVAIRCTSSSAEAAERTANALAQAYAERVRACWQTQMHRRCESAQALAAQARDELLKAQARLDLFLQSQTALEHNGAALDLHGAESTPERHGADVEAPGQAPRENSVPQQGRSAAVPLPQIRRGRPKGTRGEGGRPEGTQSRSIENPRWVELSRRVEQLRERRAELLETRTFSHPLVQQVTEDLKDAEERLAAEPHWIPNEPAEPSGASDSRAQRARRVINPFVRSEAPPPAAAQADRPQSESARAGRPPADQPKSSESAQAELGELAGSNQHPAARERAPVALSGREAAIPSLAQLRQELDGAAAAYAQAAERERRAWQAASQQPRIECVLADAAPRAPVAPLGRLGWLAGLAGLLTAVGMGWE